VKKGFDIKFWLGIAISVFFMVLVFRKIDFHQLWAAFLTVDYRYVLFAVICTFISYFLRAVRWRYLLIHEKRIPLSSLYPATVIGYMANNVLPARLGEFVRAYVLAQQEGLQTPAVFASLVIDRLFDIITVMLILLYTLFNLRLPPGHSEAETYLRLGGVALFILFLALLTFLLLLKRQTMRTLAWTGFLLRPFPRQLADLVIPLLGSFIDGIRMTSKGRHILAVLVLSLAVWLFCIIPVDLVLRAFHIHLPIIASMFILLFLVVAVALPAAPGSIGTYEWSCVVGLRALGISEPVAASIALVMHGISFFPVIIAGFYHLWRNKISLNSVRKAGESA
jgi:uncharacterized protein (TIRG00374 family)